MYLGIENKLNLHFMCAFSAASSLRIQIHEFTVPLTSHTPAPDLTFTLMSLFLCYWQVFLNISLKVVR